MPTVEQVIKDPEFYDLPYEERRKVLIQIDPDFSALDSSEQDKAISGLEQQFGSKQVAPQQVEIPLKQAHSPELMPSHEPVLKPPESTFDRTMKGAVRTLEPITRPLLEGGGLVAGGTLGTLGGIETGPGAILTGILGAGAGYSAGKGLQDTLDIYSGAKQPYQNVGEAALQTAKDVGEGALLEGGGRLVGAALAPAKVAGKWVFKKIGEIGAGAGLGGAAGYAAGGPKEAVEGAALGAAAGAGLKYAPKALANRAGKVLMAAVDDGGSAIYARNTKEANAIEKIINKAAPEGGPKFKFSLAQKSDNPATIMLERTQTHGGSDTAARLYKERIAENNAALRNYYEKNFPGEYGVDDLIGSLKQRQTALSEGVQTAQQSAAKSAATLPQAEPQATGQALVDELSAAKTATKQKASDLYGKIPEAKINIEGMLKDFEDISKPMSKFEDPGNIPSILGRVKEVIGEGSEASLADLQGLRSELLAQARQVRSSATPNERMVSRLNQAASSVEKAISEAESGSENLKPANKFFKENYTQVFKQGTVGDILRKGPRGETTRIPIEKIPNRIWSGKTGAGVEDLTKAIGKEKTANIMRDHAAYDLMSTPGILDQDGYIVGAKLNQWYSKNKVLLKKLGIQSDFKGVIAAQEAANAAKAAASEFEKTAAAKALGADPEKAIAAAMTGNKTGKAASELLGMVKGDKAATEGLKKALADHIVTMSETTAKDIRGGDLLSYSKFVNNKKKYMPAIKEIYKDDPKKIKALMAMQKAYEIMVRTSKSPIGGGSDTKELAATALGKIMGIAHRAPGVKILYDFFKSQGDKKVNEIVSEALFYPEYAETLMTAFRSGMTPKTFNKAMNGKVIDLAKYRQSGIARAASVMGVGANEYNESTNQK